MGQEHLGRRFGVGVEEGDAAERAVEEIEIARGVGGQVSIDDDRRALGVAPGDLFKNGEDQSSPFRRRQHPREGFLRV